jgi:hypothetical protein
MEKYATTPEAGKVSYENGFADVGCITLFSSRRLTQAKRRMGDWDRSKASRKFSFSPGLHPSKLSSILSRTPPVATFASISKIPKLP